MRLEPDDACSDMESHGSRLSIDGSAVGPAKAEPDGRLPTTLMVNLASVMERTDEQLLPSVYKCAAPTHSPSAAQLPHPFPALRYVACSFDASLGAPARARCTRLQRRPRGSIAAAAAQQPCGGGTHHARACDPTDPQLKHAEQPRRLHRAQSSWGT